MDASKPDRVPGFELYGPRFSRCLRVARHVPALREFVCDEPVCQLFQPATQTPCSEHQSSRIVRDKTYSVSRAVPDPKVPELLRSDASAPRERFFKRRPDASASAKVEPRVFDSLHRKIDPRRGARCSEHAGALSLYPPCELLKVHRSWPSRVSVLKVNAAGGTAPMLPTKTLVSTVVAVAHGVPPKLLATAEWPGIKGALPAEVHQVASTATLRLA